MTAVWWHGKPMNSLDSWCHLPFVKIAGADYGELESSNIARWSESGQWRVRWPPTKSHRGKKHNLPTRPLESNWAGGAKKDIHFFVFAIS